MQMGRGRGRWGGGGGEGEVGRGVGVGRGWGWGGGGGWGGQELAKYFHEKVHELQNTMSWYLSAYLIRTCIADEHL